MTTGKPKQRILTAFTAVLIAFFAHQPSQKVLAQADSSRTEWIKVYFNMPVDTSVALPGNRANGSSDLIGTLETLIDSAKVSVDLCVYDLEHPRIGRALVRAHKRGVRVRLITDNYNRTDAREVDERMWQMLRAGGIISIDDDGDIYHPEQGIKDHSLTNAGADMHHKFCVVDAETPSPNDDYVWTGSANMTYTGAFNTNHTIIIKDNEIAAAYLHEFEQMWGGSGDLPKPEEALFHKDKEPYPHHTFHVGEDKVEVYFAPVNREGTKPSISKRLVEVMKQEAQHDIHFQAFAITPDIPISETMWQMSARGEIQLNGLIDRSYYYRYKKQGAIWASPFSRLANRNIRPSDELRKLHHKVMLFDVAHPDPTDQAAAVAGSYNFSNNAEYNNDENILLIYSDRIANQYYQDWSGVMKRAMGKMEPPAPPIRTDTVYVVENVQRGDRFEVELVPGFDYPIDLLGVEAPLFYEDADSIEYYGYQSKVYLANLLEGKRVTVAGPFGEVPDHKYGRFYAYVHLENGTFVNRDVLTNGYGRYSKYYYQPRDSVTQFKNYVEHARQKGRGMWEHPQKVGQKFAVTKLEGGSSSTANVTFPININTAQAEVLEELPGIGPSYARRIIEYREQNGGFRSPRELRKIKGIGPKTYAGLKDKVVVE